jgi:multidrug efflux pump subunit AcrA (membrane-fusion protein)
MAASLVAFMGVATQAHAQDRDHHDRGRDRDHGRGRGEQASRYGQSVSQQEQQRRIQEEQERQREYQARLDAQLRAAQAQQARLQAERHAAQIQANQRYMDALRAQEAQARAQRRYDRDAYITSPMTYRYRYGNVARETNQYGVDLLRQAVNNGYGQGYQQGEADRADGLRSNYTRSFAYQDANLGYTGAYVPESDYNYYFRQGFQRGYQDGYAHQSRYGSYNNGTGSVLGNILSGILGLTQIH